MGSGSSVKIWEAVGTRGGSSMKNLGPFWRESLEAVRA